MKREMEALAQRHRSVSWCSSSRAGHQTETIFQPDDVLRDVELSRFSERGF